MPSIVDFTVIRPIAKGAFGRVFLARKKKTGDLFAIKVQRKDKCLIEQDHAKRVMSERDILVQAHSPPSPPPSPPAPTPALLLPPAAAATPRA